MGWEARRVGISQSEQRRLTLPAASALPANTNITAYRSGFWLPNASVSASFGGRSAWIFTVDGQAQVAVDAYTGNILGSTALQ